MKKEVLVLLFLIACAPVEEVKVSAPTPEPTPRPEVIETPVPVEPEPVQIKATEIEKEEVVAEVPGECGTFGCFPGDKVVADMEMDLFYDCSCPRARWIKPEMVLCFESEEATLERGYRKAQSC